MKRILVTGLAIIALASCSKKDNVYTDEFSYSGPVLVNFNNYGGFISEEVTIEDKWVEQEFEVKITNTKDPLETPAKVVLMVDENPINEYNTANGTNLSLVPLAAYRFEEREITLPRGARTAKFKFQVNTAKFNLSANSAFGISIKDVTGGAVVNKDDSQTRLVIEYITRNAWDGAYRMYSSFSRSDLPNYVGYNASPAGYFEPYLMVTSGGRTVDACINTAMYGVFPTQIVYDASTGGGVFFTGVNPRLSIDASNNVTVLPAISTSVAFLTNSAEIAASKYYPTGIPGVAKTTNKKTLVAHFRWSSAGVDRIAKDTFVYIQPR